MSRTVENIVILFFKHFLCLEIFSHHIEHFFIELNMSNCGLEFDQALDIGLFKPGHEVIFEDWPRHEGMHTAAKMIHERIVREFI